MPNKLIVYWRLFHRVVVCAQARSETPSAGSLCGAGIYSFLNGRALLT
jgi:hypothetical protein